MSIGDTNNPFRLGTLLVEPNLNRLSDGDRVLALEPRVMDVLTYLASQPGKTVSADDLMGAVWHGRAHADNTIYQAVADLRKALGDDIHNPRYIETISKKGYRLICPVTPVAADSELPEIAFHSPNGRRHRRRNLAIFAGIASIAVAIVLTVNLKLRDQLLTTDDGPRERSVAVLPFVDMSEDGSQQYLGDGITEELIHVLSNLPGLRVIARTSSFAFRDNKDIRQIGSELNVATILEGSIRKDGDRIRVTSQLVDARNGYHLWSQTFDRRTTDLFKIQDEIAAAIATTFEYQALDALAIDDHAARTVELQTYELYLLGQHQLHKRFQSGYIRAMEYFERAIESDPGFTRAYAGLSESYASQSYSNNDSELLRKAESAAEYALRLDDQSAEAFAALGHVKRIKKDYSGAEAAFVKAIELNPNDARAHSRLAYAYNVQGRDDDALVMLQKALALNPMSGELNSAMAQTQYIRTDHDWDSAFKYFERAIQRDPDYPGSYGPVALYYSATGQLDRAIPYLKKLGDLADRPIKVGGSQVILAGIYVDIGDYDSAANLIREMREIESDHRGATNVDIHLQLARRDFSAARGLVHSALSKHIGIDGVMSLMAFYEMVIGDMDHAEEIYTHVAAAPASPDIHRNTIDDRDTNLHRSNELAWGMLGAVNLAYLHNSNGDTGAARELLVKAREYIESRDHPWFVPSIAYVYAQIAAIEGNNNAAIEYVRTAVEAGWTKAWFGRLDPIMKDLREDARYMQILEELEDKLMEMREHPQMLASNEP